MEWTGGDSAERIGNAYAAVDLSLFGNTAVSCCTVVSSCSSTSGGATDICCMVGDDFSAADLSHCCQGSQTSLNTSDGIGFSIAMQCCERNADNRSTIVVLDQRGSDGGGICIIEFVGVRCAEILLAAEASSSSPEFDFACSTVKTDSTNNAAPVLLGHVIPVRIQHFGLR